LFKNVVYETIGFLRTDMLWNSSMFYSAIDADSEGEEGKYYTFAKAEIDRVLKEKSGLFCHYYNVIEEGNWEHGLNILYTDNCMPQNNKSLSELNPLRAMLLEYRMKRISPAIDFKMLTSWNALAITGLLDSYKAFNDSAILQLAQNVAQFISDNLIASDSGIYRNYANGNACIKGFLDDYAFTAEAFIKLYQHTFNEKWLLIANSLAQYVVAHFHDQNTGMFFYSEGNDEHVIARQTEYSDNVLPASNSVMSAVFYQLSVYFSNMQYRNFAFQIATNISTKISHPEYFSNTLRFMLNLVNEPPVVLVASENAFALLPNLQKDLPFNALIGGAFNNQSEVPLLQNRFKAGQTLFYVCTGTGCKMPVNTVAEVSDLLRK